MYLYSVTSQKQKTDGFVYFMTAASILMEFLLQILGIFFVFKEFFYLFLKN